MKATLNTQTLDTQILIRGTKQDRQLLKSIAAERETTASDLIRSFIRSLESQANCN